MASLWCRKLSMVSELKAFCCAQSSPRAPTFLKHILAPNKGRGPNGKRPTAARIQGHPTMRPIFLPTSTRAPRPSLSSRTNVLLRMARTSTPDSLPILEESRTVQSSPPALFTPTAGYCGRNSPATSSHCCEEVIRPPSIRSIRSFQKRSRAKQTSTTMTPIATSMETRRAMKISRTARLSRGCLLRRRLVTPQRTRQKWTPMLQSRFLHLAEDKPY